MREPQQLLRRDVRRIITFLLVGLLAASLFFLETGGECCADGLTLTGFPRDLVSLRDTVTITWAEAVSGTFQYSPVPGGGLPQNYPLTISHTLVQKPGLFQFIPEGQMAPGVYYCVVNSGRGASVEFVLAVESDQAPQMISPRTAQGTEGIHTTSPVFQWQGVAGVPFYHILLSDQPFEITEDGEGQLCVTGANIIWQAITAETSIPYGSPDPSGTLPTVQSPPLVKGLRYNWLVLNNYGNNPAFTSAVTAGPAGFEVAAQSPFAPPVLMEPVGGSCLFGNQIGFRWSEVAEALAYHFYLFELQREGGNTVALPIFHTVTTRTALQVTASSLMRSGDYAWKVLAADASGYGAMSDEAQFIYFTQSATLVVRARDDNGTIHDPGDDLPLPRVEVNIEEQPGQFRTRTLITDEAGHADCQLPLGTYIVEGHKNGYEAAAEMTSLLEDGQVGEIILTLARSPSAIHGTVIDQNSSPVPQARVSAQEVSGGPERRTETKSNGTFLLHLREGTWRIAVEKPGYASPRNRFVTVRFGEDLDLDREEMGGPFVLVENQYLLTGTVTDPRGQAIWQAEVRVSDGLKELRDQTDGLGKFAFSIEPGVWELVVAKVGYASPQPEAVTITDADVQKNLVLIPRATLVSGRVTDGQRKISGATLRAVPLVGPQVSGETDEGGSFILSLLPGTYRLRAEARGYVQARPLHLTLGLGETLSGLEILMLPANASISGRVLTEDGVGLGGVLVTNGKAKTHTASDGSYRLEVLAGRQHLKACLTGYISAESSVLPVAPGQNLSGVDFVLTGNAGVLEGQVIKGGQGVSGAAVRAQSQEGRLEEVHTDATGRYRFSLMPGSYEVSANKAGLIPQTETITAVAKAGQWAILDDYPMQENLAQISGTVVEGSHPLEGVAVLLEDLGPLGPTYWTITNPDGQFTLMVAAGEGYALTGARAGYLAKRDTVLATSPGSAVGVLLDLEPCDSQVKGKVFSQKGHPLAGASVLASSLTQTFETTSAMDGSYRLYLKAGTYTIEASKPGYVAQATEVDAPVGVVMQELDFALPENRAALVGMIRNAVSGQPLEGALVTAEEVSSGQGKTAHTDGQGQFSLENLPSGIYRISVHLSGFAPGELSERILLGGEYLTLDLPLEPLTGGIQGYVWQGSTSVAGATVATTMSADQASQTVSDEAGAFSLSGLPEGTWVLQAFKNGYTTISADTIDLEESEIESAELFLRANRGVIAGRVAEGPVGIGGVMVTAMGYKGNFAADTSGSDGCYRLTRLAEDSYHLRVCAQGWSAIPAETTVALTEGDTVAVDFGLRRSNLAISGLVSEKGGDPLAEVTVRATGPSRSHETRTDGSGSYTIRGLSSYTEYTVETVIYEEGYENTSVTAQLVEADLDGVNLEVDVTQGSIAGQVGVEGATITVVGQGNGVQKSVLSQPDGSYRVRHLRAGDYLVSAQKLGYSCLPSRRAVEDLGPRQGRTGIDFTMQPDALTIQGRVVDQDGDPVADAPVVAWSVELSLSDTTDSAGQYHVWSLFPEQSYQVGTQLPFNLYENGQMTVAVGRKDVVAPDLVVGAHSAAIQGLVLDQQGAPVEGAVVKRSLEEQKDTTDASGQYRFSGLWAGHCTLSVSVVGWSSSTQTVELAKGQTVQADFHLQPVQNAIYGEVRQEGQPLGGAVMTLSAPGKWMATDTVDFNGYYAFEELSSSLLYDLTVQKRGYRAEQTSGLTVAAGESRRVDLSPSPIPNAIRGTVLDGKTRRPAPGAVVRAVGLNGVTKADTTDGLGDYCLSDLRTGSYTVVGQHGPLAGKAQVLSLQRGKARRVDFHLDVAGSLAGQVSYQSIGRAGALVTAVHLQTGTPYSGVSGADGQFCIPGLPAGQYHLSVAICGFEAAEDWGTFTVTPGEPGTVDLALRPGDISLAGAVRDVAARPIAGALVRARVGDQGDSTVTDAWGNYALDMPSPAECVVETQVQGYHVAPAETVSIHRGGPVLVDFQLVPQANTVFGVVTDGGTGNPLGDVLVTLEDSLGNATVDTTNLRGEYLFCALPGRYLLWAQKDGYEPGEPREIVFSPGGFVSQDMVLNPQLTLAPISGSATWGPDPLSGVRVTVKSLSQSSIDSTWTAQDGGYRFEQLPAPENYLLQATKAGFQSLSSGLIWVTSQGHQWDPHFPRGQIRWLITTEGTTPMPGVQLHLTGAGIDTAMYTDPTGACQTSAHLQEGEYLVSIAGDQEYLPVATYSIQLGSDEDRLEAVNLSLRHTPWPSDSALSVGQEAPIRAEVFAPDESTQVHLYYRGPEELDFVEVEMVPEGKKSSYQKRERAAGQEENKARAGANGAYYRGTIPSQTSPGTLEYFIEARHHGFLYSCRSDPWTITVSNRGMPHTAHISPQEKRLSRGLPYIFLVQVYDDEGSNLSSLLTEEDVVWSVLEGPGQINKSTENPTQATYVSQEDGTARIGATVTLSGITVGAQALVINQTAVLGQLEILGPAQPAISNQSQATFRYAAQDTSGEEMSIWPRWGFQPEGAGTLSRSLNGDKVYFVPEENFIGQVRIFLTDGISGQTSEYNAGEGLAEWEWGLGVYHLLVGCAPGAVLQDGSGFRLVIPDSVLTPGYTAQISLRVPSVPDVKRYTSRHEIHGQVYHLQSTSSAWFRQPLELVLPIAPEARSLAVVIGRWDPAELAWVELGGIRSGNEIWAQVDHFSQFAVLALSEPLAVKEIQLLPNPFTPHDPYGLQLGFTLSTDRARKPFVTIKVYNMTGDLVRTICQNEPVPKGRYLPGESFLDSRGGDITTWDGRTESGELARNGRYLIYFRAEDSGGTVEALKTVVLIK